MSDDLYAPLLANIKQTLSKNGYPDKRVSLPLERMYEVAHSKGLNFNKALTLLDEQGIRHEKTSEKIIFSPKPSTQSLDDIMMKVDETLRAMSPEQRQQLEDFYRNMSDEQREEALNKARELGLNL